MFLRIQEVHNTVFMSQELAKRCIWLNRVYTPTTKTPDNLNTVEAELYRRLHILQRDLRVTTTIIIPKIFIRTTLFFLLESTGRKAHRQSSSQIRRRRFEHGHSRTRTVHFGCYYSSQKAPDRHGRCHNRRAPRQVHVEAELRNRRSSIRRAQPTDRFLPEGCPMQREQREDHTGN